MAFSTRSHINFPIVLRIIGWLLMIEAAFMTIPLITSVIYNDGDFPAFAITTGVTAIIGALMTLCIHPTHSHMAKREAFLLTALVWCVFSIFGMLPFILSPISLSVSDAFFEAMSGFTTTGASVIVDVENLPHGILIWRSLMQWIGGMGIILFTLAVIPMLNHSGGMQMFNAEVPGITHDKIRPRISQTAKRLWFVYISLSVVLCFLLWLGPMNLFDSVCHMMTTISTGGFSTRNASIAAWDSPYVDIVLTIFMFLGGVNFTLIYRAATGNFRSLWENDTLRAYLRIIFITYIFFTIAIIYNGQASSIVDVTVAPLFQIITTMSSTGLVVANFENWGPFVMALMFLLMFFGACAGSTSGGAKIDRMLYLIKNTRNELHRTIHPNAILAVRINGKVIPADITAKVIAFLCIYVMVIMIGGIVLSAMHIPLVDAFFSSFSCVSNTGLGAGVTGYGGSYDIIPNAGKWVLSFLMMIGRLELFTVLILFTPGFWKK